MLHGTHEPRLVILSVVVACLASYAALQLSGRVAVAQGRAWRIWLGGSAFTMGIGIWSMHFVAMLAFRIGPPSRGVGAPGLPIAYGVDLLILSVLVAIAASLLAFVTISRPHGGFGRLAIASIFMGPAIAGMHYIGMAAVRIAATITYDMALVWLSVAIAITASFAALRLSVAFGSDGETTYPAWAKPASAVLMGVAICGMHYTGMMAARFTPVDAPPPDGPFIIATDGLAYTVGFAAALIAAIAVVAVLLDRSVRAKLAEAEAVRQSEERIRLLLEGVRDYALFSLDPQGRVAQWNAGAERLTGYAAEEAVGRHHSMFFPPEEVEHAHQILRDALASGRAQEDAWRVRKDGSRFLASVVISPLHDASGAHVGFSKLVRDVTEQWRADTALRDSQERLQFALAAARMTTWELDYETETVSRSGSARLYTGVPGSTETERLDDVVAGVHPDDRTTLLEAIRRGRTEGQFEVDFRRVADGTIRWFNAIGRRTTDSGGHGNRIVGLTTDITERRHLEDQLRQAQKMEAIGQLAGGIAHDFNNLLTVITGNVESMLESLASSDPNHDALREVMSASDRAASLTRQLLAFSRRQLIQSRPLDINMVVTEIEPMLRRLIGEDITISTSLAAAAPVLADRGQLEQILLNLAVNARDAMPRGGTIRIETSSVSVGEADRAADAAIAPGTYVMLAVIDTGVGIDPAIQHRVFEPFFTTKDATMGTGLGLSMVYGIVNQSGGFIRVESEPDRGAAFKVFLPSAPLPTVEAVPVRGSAADEGVLSGTILLVEDEDAVRRLSRQILERHGYRVIEAPNGLDAVEVAERYNGPIDGLVTDVVMPDMGGRELVDRLLVQRPDLKVLFMSGYTDDDIIRRGLLNPSMAFLQKPFAAKALVAAVRNTLAGGQTAGARGNE